MFHTRFFGYNSTNNTSGVGVMLKKHFKTCVSCDCPLEYEMCLGLHICEECESGLEQDPGEQMTVTSASSAGIEPQNIGDMGHGQMGAP